MIELAEDSAEEERMIASRIMKGKSHAVESYGVAFKIGECIFGRDSLRVGYLINKMAEIRFDLRDDPEFRIIEDEKVSFDFDDEEWNFKIDDEEE